MTEIRTSIFEDMEHVTEGSELGGKSGSDVKAKITEETNSQVQISSFENKKIQRILLNY